MANDKLTENFTEDLKKILKESNIEDIDLNIPKTEKLLRDIIDNYNKISSLETNGNYTNTSLEEAGKNRERLLSDLKISYTNVLSRLKELGANISVFPNSLEKSVKQMENKKLSSQEHIKAIADFVVENNLSLQKVMEVYSEFNDRIYNNYTHKVGGVKSDSSDLEDKAFKLTVKYFNIQKIRKSRGEKD
jgi:DNA-binding ferritin-like protein